MSEVSHRSTALAERLRATSGPPRCGQHLLPTPEVIALATTTIGSVPNQHLGGNFPGIWHDSRPDRTDHLVREVCCDT
jgi:hypothetical protein